MRGICWRSGLCMLLLVGAAKAAVINFEWGSIDGQPLPRGTTDIVVEGTRTCTINVWLTLETSGFPPSEEQLGLMLYALSMYPAPSEPPGVEIIGYHNDLEPAYKYDNQPGGGGSWTLTEILLSEGQEPIAAGEWLVSTIVVRVSWGEKWFYVNDPNTDIALYRPDLVTVIPFTLGSGSTWNPLHLIQVPEPATVGLLMLGGAGALYRRPRRATGVREKV